MSDEEFKKKVKKLADHITDLWSDYFTNLSLNSYIPPQRKLASKYLGIADDEFLVVMKQHTDVFREYGILYMPVKRAGYIILLNRPMYRKHAQTLCDICDAIDIYDFDNPVRDPSGTRRMDFAHEVAEHMHSKGCKQKKAPQLKKDYEAILENKAGKEPEIIAVAQFIVKLMREHAKGATLRK